MKPTTYRAVKSIVSKQIRNHDEYHSYTAFGTLGPTSAVAQVVDLTSVAQGTAYYQRLGALINVKDIILKFRVAEHGSAANDTIVRLIVLKWFEDNSGAADPTMADILEDTSVATNHVIMSFKADDRKFTILKDESFAFNTDVEFIMRNYVINRGLGRVQFESGVNTGRNHIYLMAITNQASYAPAVGYVFTTRFTP